MQAIATKCIAATRTKPSRIKARHSGGARSITVSTGAIPIEAATDELQHRWVAARLMEALEWGHLRLPEGGALDSGYVFVPVAK